MTPSGRPSDEALWSSMAATLRDVVLAGLDDPHRRQVAIQLVGLATYAGERGPDPMPARVDEVAGVLDDLAAAGNELVATRWTVGTDRAPVPVMAAAGEALAAAVAGGAPDTAATAVQARLRPVLLRHLSEDLATEDVLLGAFRGRLPGG